MRVLNVNISLDTNTGGGTAERTYQMTRSLSQLGIDCKVLTLSFEDNNKRTKELGKDNIISLKCLNNRFYIPKLSLRKIKLAVVDVDLIHMMSHWTILNAIVYLAAKYYRKPYVICPAGALSYFGRSKTLKKLYNKIIGKQILCNSAYCIAISDDEIIDIREYGIDSSKIVHIPNGINEEEYLKYDSNNFRLKFGLSQKKIILFVGRLNIIKGVDLLFNAFCNIFDQIPEYQLVIAGQDEGMRHDLEKIVQEQNLSDRIKFIGYISAEYKSSAYYSSSLLVIPSRQEAMSIVVLEAGITGTPVLITNRCGFDEVESVNGGRVVEATTSAIEQGLLQLLRDEEHLKILGANLKRHVKKKFLWSIIAKRHLELFYQVVKA